MFIRKMGILAVYMNNEYNNLPCIIISLFFKFSETLSSERTVMTAESGDYIVYVFL